MSVYRAYKGHSTNPKQDTRLLVHEQAGTTRFLVATNDAPPYSFKEHAISHVNFDRILIAFLISKNIPIEQPWLNPKDLGEAYDPKVVEWLIEWTSYVPLGCDGFEQYLFVPRGMDLLPIYIIFNKEDQSVQYRFISYGT
jgi:hypothetical protein